MTTSTAWPLRGRRWLRATLAALALCSAQGAVAEPGYYVVTAYPNAGQRSIDFRYWTVKHGDGPAVIWPEIGFGYGVSSRWYTELYASWVGSAGSATRLSTVDWQNDVLLTQGEYPFDLALHTLLTHQELFGGGTQLEIGPALQTDIGRTQLNANLFFERGWGPANDGVTQLKYQWQVRHRWMPLLNVGAQGFGELGRWDRWATADQQSHRAGPALFGTLPLGDGRTALYQAAYLFGSIYGRHGGMFTMRAQLAF
jgi:hypothetical protein